MWADGHEYLCLGVSWVTGEPAFHVVDVATSETVRVPLRQRRLGIRVGTPGRFCVGRYGFGDRMDTRHVPCPGHRFAAEGDQCLECVAQDEFRFAHHFHVGGYAPAALTAYMSQPHWVYVATFADAISKVGTAADGRRKSRLDEQGAVMAAYVAWTPDGRAARMLEDAVTRELALPQSRRTAAKMAALAAPAPRAHILSHHEQVVARTAALVREMCRSIEAVSVSDVWLPPADVKMFLGDALAGSRAPYPHDLTSGDHGFHVEACIGSATLVRIEPSEDAIRCVVDLGALKGARVVAGDFVSRESVVQASLF